jgi:hypothetical protein
MASMGDIKAEPNGEKKMVAHDPEPTHEEANLIKDGNVSGRLIWISLWCAAAAFSFGFSCVGRFSSSPFRPARLTPSYPTGVQ